jgi:selenocysteine lyase/cysteine desulfurase
MLTNQRSLFALPDALHYLNCASRSPYPVATMEAGRAAVERMLVPVSTAPEGYFAESEAFRGKVAELVGCSADQVAIAPAVSYGIGIAAHNWPLGPGRTVVVPDEEFPSDVYAWMAACQRSGASMVTVARPAHGEGLAVRWSQSIIDAIDDSTAVVSLSTVLWADGTAFDLTAIATRAREVDALVVVDATQSLGAAPFPYADVQPDLLLCSAYKWLFCPNQFAFSIVGDRLIDAAPFEHHWSNRLGSQDTTGTGLRDTFRQGARRFDVGGHSNDVTLSMANASLDQVLDWGPAPVADYCARLMEPLVTYLRSSPYAVPGPDDHLGHILGIRHNDFTTTERAMTEISKRNIGVSLRGDAIRVSPNVYNTPADIDVLVEALHAARP